ncbi:hypothetical protein D2N39_12710 [Gemmobacter lutimaris]|uniref:Sialate O-acetylesterase domain-containing protein n=1 Tax=Gemmobacter lutimaris TaxID=2306023 RepID=A0A398BWG4_9RHOB|nr:sialate O-acetylesterase [Gemmobacter lutimaris]RID91556.1 hypothetical protein D2N39_12710 [Gemmobacter lutimaris]
MTDRVVTFRNGTLPTGGVSPGDLAAEAAAREAADDAEVTAREAAENLGSILRLTGSTGTAQEVTATVGTAQLHIGMEIGQRMQARWLENNTGPGAKLIVSRDGVETECTIKRRNGADLAANDLLGSARYDFVVHSVDPYVVRVVGAVAKDDINGLPEALDDAFQDAAEAMNAAMDAQDTADSAVAAASAAQTAADDAQATADAALQDAAEATNDLIDLEALLDDGAKLPATKLLGIVRSGENPATVLAAYGAVQPYVWFERLDGSYRIWGAVADGAPGSTQYGTRWYAPRAVLSDDIAAQIAARLIAANNLSDLADKALARENLSVYSRASVDLLLTDKASATAFQQFVTRVLGALTGLAYRVVPYTVSPYDGAIKIAADEISYPQLWVTTPDDLAALVPGDEGPFLVSGAILTFPTKDDPLGTTRTYFVDMAASPRVVTSEVGIAVNYSKDRLILGVAHRGWYVDMANLPVTWALLPTESDPVIMFDRATLRTEALQLAVAALPVPDDVVGGPAWVTAAAGPIQIGGPMRSQTVVLQAAGVKADCSHMTVASDAVLNFVAGGTVFAGHGRTFAGQAGMHTATVPAGGLVRVTRISANATFGTVIEPLGGTVLSYAGGAEPVHDVSIALGGQSQLSLGYYRGLPGSFAHAVRDAGWMATPLDVDAHWINGATGGSSMLVTPNNWWTVGNTEGPALTAWKAAVTAADAAGQPVPECVIWMQGEADAWVVQQGTYSSTVYKDAIKSVWSAMRSHLTSLGASDPQFLVVQLGAWDFEGDDYPTGASAVRWAYQRAIDEVAYAHFAADSYDIPRPWGDVHLGGMGHYHLAHRLARAYANVIEGQANSLGPQITGATWRSATDFRAAVVGLPSGLHLPPGDMGDVASGPYPWGFQILSGANMTVEVPIIRGILDRVSRTVTLETNTNLSGCRVAFPAGFATDQRAGHLIRDEQAHGRLMGLPLRSGMSAALIAP